MSALRASFFGGMLDSDLTVGGISLRRFAPVESARKHKKERAPVDTRNHIKNIKKTRQNARL
jgi:hypothetical protein